MSLDWKPASVIGANCENCGEFVKGGLYDALTHYSECYTDEQRKANVKKSMKALGYSNSQMKEAIKKLGL